jgi:CheY-like chemotaxis protein
MPVVLDLNTVVRELEPMLRRLIGEDIRLVTDLAAGLGPIKADRNQLEQVLVNLAVNARDAMPTGGRLTIETANEDQIVPEDGPEAVAGPRVVLTVRDTGHGMDEHTRAHLFEPFFTTKEVGQGTGLGLATVYGIVRQSGGRIAVDSAPGAGAAFRIVLPRVEGVAPRGAPASDPDIRHGQETILLVEDEETLRDLTGKVLRRAGYTVLQARHGAEALSLCESHPGPIDLLVTDVIIPLLSGTEVADRVALLRPEVKVLYVSGYPDDAMLRHGVQIEATPLLRKPFTPAALLRKVREVLDPKPAAPACAATT